MKIPIFTSQLEKAREATDEANIRAKYAECVSATLTETTSKEGDNPTVTTANGVTTAVGTVKMTQQTAGFAEGATKTIKIGEIELTSAQFNTGTATITVKSDGSAPTIEIK